MSLDRDWAGTTTISIEFLMEVKTVVANEMVEEDRGKVALEYGPIVYIVEEMDNPGDWDAIDVDGDETYQVSYKILSNADGA